MRSTQVLLMLVLWPIKGVASSCVLEMTEVFHVFPHFVASSLLLLLVEEWCLFLFERLNFDVLIKRSTADIRISQTYFVCKTYSLNLILYVLRQIEHWSGFFEYR